jgi:hypothetical protein
MTDYRVSDDFFTSGIILNEHFPDFIKTLREKLDQLGRYDLSTQLSSIIAVYQAVAGNPDEFSFMAYPVPRPNFEQRKTLEIHDVERIEVEIDSGRIAIDIDCFGFINWFYISNIKYIYKPLVDLLNQHAKMQ